MVFMCISFDVLAIFFRGSSTSVVSIALKRNPKFKDWCLFKDCGTPNYMAIIYIAPSALETKGDEVATTWLVKK